MKKNNEFQWDDFSPQLYFESNYLSLHQDDKKILERLYTFLANKPRSATMLDVGSGSSFLPCLTALPFTSSVMLSDFSLKNCNWLKDQIISEAFETNWSELFEYLTGLSKAYQRTEILSKITRVSVQQSSVFELAPNQFDLCTMFFCIESATSNREEFAKGLNSFLSAPCSGGLFFAAMMRNSNGYEVGGIQFPAYRFSIDELNSLVEKQSDDFQIVEISASKPLIREGYDGFVIIHGTTLGNSDAF